jgi:hypothetical protein
MKLPQFYDSEEGFTEIHRALKITQCPFCKLFGFLILHGYLRGYDETGSDPESRRGHRIFCSNRKNRIGCGKTFSIILKSLLKHFFIRAATIWKFFSHIAKGLPKNKASQETGSIPYSSSGYRLFRRFKANQTYLKTKLFSVCEPPSSLKDDPTIQTILHLEKAFPSGDPISDFQLYFQSSFFSIPLPAYGLL